MSLMEHVRRVLGMHHDAPPMSAAQEQLAERQRRIEQRQRANDIQRRALDIQVSVLAADRRDERNRR